MMAPTLDEFATRHAGAVLVLKLDTELNPKVAARFAIRGIPTLIVFQDGKERGRHVGVADLQRLEALAGVSAG
jgi:thioredoxin-like negative regulator of GroEL